jgi:rhodanese-related sulfurtransferase
MQPQKLLKRMKAKHPPAIIDVRTVFEFRKGYIPGAIHAQTWKILNDILKRSSIWR